MLLILGLTLSGCAIAQGLDSWQNERRQRLAAEASEKQAEQDRAEAIREFKKNLHPGLKMSEVKDGIGEPNRVEFTKNQTIHWYDGKHPFWLTYDSNGILQSKLFDTATAEQRRANAAIENERENQRRQQLAQDLAKASATAAKGLAAVPDEKIKSTDYACFNRCTHSGSQWEFCHSKCDY